MACYRVCNSSNGSAIIIVTLSGSGCYDIISEVISSTSLPHSAELVEGRVYLAPLVVDGDPLDETLICRRGECFTLYLHASHAILSRLEAFFREKGVEKQDEIPNESPRHKALRQARTRKACHLFGATSSAALRGYLESALEAHDRDALTTLISRSSYGVLAQRSLEIFLTGPTNAGKSTLFNFLLDKELSLVSNRKYTTRDALSASVVIEGLEVDLYDTPGSGTFEGAAHDRDSYTHFETLMAGADIIVRFHPLDEDIPATLEEHPKIVHLFSKKDVASPETLRTVVEAFGDQVVFSAVTGDGVEEVRKALVTKVLPQIVPEQGDVVCFTEEQVRIVELIHEKMLVSAEEARKEYQNHEEMFQ